MAISTIRSVVLALAGLAAQGLVAPVYADTVNPTGYNLGMIAAPASVSFSHVAFTTGGNNSCAGSAPYNFCDTFTFSLSPSATVNSIVASLNLAGLFNITNLQVNLKNLSTASLIQAWTTPSGNGEVAVITANNLGAANYALNIRGKVDGIAGGTYVGAVNAASPVPVPGALGLLLLGLGSLGFISKRKGQ